MTKDLPLASLRASEATSNSSYALSTPVIITTPSESSALSNPLPPQRRPSPDFANRSSNHRPPIAEERTRTASSHKVVGYDGDFKRYGDLESEAMDGKSMHKSTDGRSGVPLLKDERGRQSYDAGESSASPPDLPHRRSNLRSRSPDLEAKNATKTKYTYAAFFLGLSLVSFVVQTETAVYIQRDLGWNKAYCMLYLTHGSWSVLWPMTLLMLRIRNRKTPWAAFWRRHTHILRTTAQMVKTQNLHLTTRDSRESPVPYMLKMTAFVTTALTIAGGSWYVAVDMTSASDLTAIYNCSAFFAYAFSIPLLGDKLRWGKVFSVAVAIVGVFMVAYGDSGPVEHGGKSGGSIGDAPKDSDTLNPADAEAKNRFLGNIVIGIGSVLYGLYEVLYKRLACPPEGTSTGRGMIFAMCFGSCIGSFTLFVLWIPLPILHLTGLETFELPRGEAAWMMAISVLANATFSGSFLILISLTSPVLSSVAALLTIFLVSIVDWLLGGVPMSSVAIGGGILIIGAFLLLSWSTYRELDAERRESLERDGIVSESENDE